MKAKWAIRWSVILYFWDAVADVSLPATEDVVATSQSGHIHDQILRGISSIHH